MEYLLEQEWEVPRVAEKLPLRFSPEDCTDSGLNVPCQRCDDSDERAQLSY